MKKVLMLLLLYVPEMALGAGGFTGLTVSSGTFSTISTYGNNDGGNRQAIILGDRVSSNTATVDALGSVQVYVNNPTTASVTGTFWQTTQPVSVATPYTVILTTNGVNASTVTAVLNGAIPTGANTIGAISNTGFNVNNTPTVVGASSDTANNLTTKLPVLAARSNSSAPTWIEGGMVPLSVDNAGALRVSGSSGGGVANLQIRNAANSWADVGYGGTVISSVPVSIIGTVQVSGASGGGIIQSLSVIGSTTSVGYALGASSLPVNVTNASLPVTQSGAWSVNTGTDTKLVSVTNAISATITDVTTGSVSGTFPGILAGIGFVNPSGTTQGGAVTVSSAIFTTDRMNVTDASYSASTTTYTLFNSSQDITGICGNATNTVLVYGLRVSCTQSTAGIIPITVVKRSTAYIGAWSTMTATPQDSNYTVVRSTALYMTAANLTNGTLVGYVDSQQIGCMAAATASPNDAYYSPSSWKNKPIVLRGAAQCLGVNIQSASVSGGKFAANWDWLETTSP